MDSIEMKNFHSAAVEVEYQDLVAAEGEELNRASRQVSVDRWRYW